jgi:hypothetical protein
MSKPIRRLAAAVIAALALGIGSAAWAASSASAAPVSAGAVSASSAPSAVKACTASQLSVWISPDAINGAAGTWFYPLEFTNISGHACATGGYPGVSATGPGGKQLGLAAGRNPLYKGKVVTIPAGGTAHALFAYGSAEVSTSGCKPKAAAELKVYPPNSKVAIHAFFDLPACTVGGRHVYLQVAVIQPGTNI